MKALEIENKEITEEELLAKARELPGAWTGLKIAVLMLLKQGYRPTELNKIFGLSRQTITRWIHQANEKGLDSLEKTPPPGRPSQMNEEVRRQIREDMREEPRKYGLPKGKWTPHILQLHLRRKYGIKVKNRQARNYFDELKPAPRKRALRILGQPIKT